MPGRDSSTCGSSDGFFLDALAEVDERYGGGWATEPGASAGRDGVGEPDRPDPVSAARNGAYGDSVARLLAFGGHEVAREYYYNDAGAQLERFRASIDALRRGEPVPEDGYHGDYVAELAAARGRSGAADARVDRGERGAVPRALRQLGAAERAEKRLPELLPRLDTYEAEGAVWARSSAYGDEQDWVLIRSTDRGGTPTYRAADVAYLVDKLERGFDRAIYVLGADHHATAKWYAAIARMLGYDPERVEVLLYQFVHLTRGGEAAKVSKRAGNVVFLDDFIDEVGVDAARWYLVNRGPDQAIEIDLDLAAEKSRRTRSTTSSTRTRGSPRFFGTRSAKRSAARRRGPLAAEEKELIKRLTDFPATVREAALTARPATAPRLLDSTRRRLPSLLPRVPRARRPGAGIPARPLPRRRSSVIARSLDLVGVEAPERM